MANACLELAVLVAIGLSLHSGTVLSAEGNVTQAALEDQDEISEMYMATFKERYRRLIPYMTYYVVNNYVNQPYQTSPSPSKLTPESTSLRKPPYFFVRPNNVINQQNIRYQDTPKKPEDEFVPSIQYDPKVTGPGNGHFVPIRYGTKINYNDAYPPLITHEAYSKAKPTYDTLPHNVRQSSTLRPLKTYSPISEKEYLRAKPTIKPLLEQTHSDYLLDYVTRPIGKVTADSGYSVDGFESLRYVTPVYPRLRKPVRIPKPLAGRPGPRFPPAHLNYIVKSLQLTNQLPEVLNKDNLDSSIKTLVEILDILNSVKKEEVTASVSPKPNVPKFDEYKGPRVITESHYEATTAATGVQRLKAPNSYATKYKEKYQPQVHNVNSLNREKIIEYYVPVIQDVYVKDVPQSTDIPDVKEQGEYSYGTDHANDDAPRNNEFVFVPPSTTTESTPREQPKQNVLKTHSLTIPPSLKYGATRGKPHVDYPAYAAIPETDFNCKKQRYKGFFGDPATGCQVWHYCDLNGGKSSFLCPNGTIFSQVALTCDWWFNVKCEATTQLYVLNERLYKYILPIMPKFPEDFTGPEVDRYLELKFKEMEEKLKEKKLKKQKEDNENPKNNLQSSKNKE